MQDHVQGSAQLPTQVTLDINYLLILLKLGVKLACCWNLLAPCVSNSPTGLELSQAPPETRGFLGRAEWRRQWSSTCFPHHYKLDFILLI